MDDFDLEKVAKAIEADAGEALPEIRQALSEAQANSGRVSTPEQIMVRSTRHPTGLTQLELTRELIAA